MNLKLRLVLAGTALALSTWSAQAASSAASSASESVATSVGSLSDSVKGSSNSSTNDKKVAAGDYRVEQVTAVADRPGMVRVALKADADSTGQGAFELQLPARALEGAALQTQDVVSVRAQNFGLEFARADNGKTFFLALADAWRHDLHTRAVTP